MISSWYDKQAIIVILVVLIVTVIVVSMVVMVTWKEAVRLYQGPREHRRNRQHFSILCYFLALVIKSIMIMFGNFHDSYQQSYRLYTQYFLLVLMGKRKSFEFFCMYFLTHESCLAVCAGKITSGDKFCVHELVKCQCWHWPSACFTRLSQFLTPN